MKFYWFGDSWVIGDELSDPVNQRFSKLVSDHYGAECVNLASKGSNINALPLRLSQILTDISGNDIVFFCLTSSSRVGFFDETGVFKNVLLNAYPVHTPHPHSDKWFRYFDNAKQRLYNYDTVVNLLWLWCLHKNINCYFMNLFTTESQQLINCVPDSAWLVPRDKCVAQWILTYIDNEYGSVIANDCPQILDQQWALQQKQVEQYIRPGYAHPNSMGHTVIANNLITLLDERFRI